MKRHPIGIATLALAVSLAGLGGHAHAAGDDREQRETKARRACAVGSVDEGIESLAKLFVEYGHPNYVYNQARCFQQNRRAEEAIGRFREYLRLAPDAPLDTRARVERFIHELEEPRPVPPGPATITAPPITPPRAPAGLDARTQSPALSNDPPRARSIWAVALGGVAVAGAALGVISGLQIRAQESDVQNARSGQFDVDQLAAAQSRAQRFQRFQWVGYGVSGAALIAAAACLTLGADESAATGRAVALLGSVGPDGGTLGIVGRF